MLPLRPSDYGAVGLEIGSHSDQNCLLCTTVAVFWYLSFCFCTFQIPSSLKSSDTNFLAKQIANNFFLEKTLLGTISD